MTDYDGPRRMMMLMRENVYYIRTDNGYDVLGRAITNNDEKL